LGDGGCHEIGMSIYIFTKDIDAIKNTKDGVNPRGRGCNISISFSPRIICK